jgi:hypothetical protein
MILLSIIALVGWGLLWATIVMNKPSGQQMDEALDYIQELKAKIERLERNDQ